MTDFTNKRFDASTWLAVARIALGLVLIIGGWKLAFPEDPSGLASSYVDPETGWIAPYVATSIQETIGLEIITFLNIMGWIEMGVGTGLVLGFMTPVLGGVAAVMFWSFAMSNPVVGAIRLSRDLALMGIAAAVASGGSGRWSLDTTLNLPATFGAWVAERKGTVLALIRYSLAYTLIVSALFFDGVMANVLNSTLSVWMVGAMGLMLLIGVYPRIVLGVFVAWMVVMIGINVVHDPIYAGLDAVKREIGMAAAALFYTLVGSDPWTLWSVRKYSSDVSNVKQHQTASP